MCGRMCVYVAVINYIDRVIWQLLLNVFPQSAEISSQIPDEFPAQIPSIHTTVSSVPCAGHQVKSTLLLFSEPNRITM